MEMKTELMRHLEYEITAACADFKMTDDPDYGRYVGAMEAADRRIAELEAALRHAMKFDDALRQIAFGNWSNVKPDSQAASDLAQIVAEMQRIAAEVIQ